MLKTRSFLLFAACLFLLLGCGLTAPVTGPQPTQTPKGNPGDINFDYSAVAQDVTLETVPAVPATHDGPYWEGTPQYRRLTLTGYSVTEHRLQPQIIIYTVADLAPANETMGKYAADLQALLNSHQVGAQIPFLPVSNEGQLIRPRMEFMDFKSGQGIQFLTQLSQGMTVINNHELIFAYQGLTNDGKYYISAIFPVTNAALPAGSEMTDGQKKLLEDFPSYQSATMDLLEDQPADSFTPDLNALSALIRSIEVK